VDRLKHSLNSYPLFADRRVVESFAPLNRPYTSRLDLFSVEGAARHVPRWHGPSGRPEWRPVRARLASPRRTRSLARLPETRLVEPVDGQLVLYGKLTQRVHPKDFVLVTHSEAPECFWVQVVKHEDGIIWGIVDNSLIFVDWPQGKKIRFAMCRVFDVYAGEA